MSIRDPGGGGACDEELNEGQLDLLHAHAGNSCLLLFAGGPPCTISPFHFSLSYLLIRPLPIRPPLRFSIDLWTEGRESVGSAMCI